MSDLLPINPDLLDKTDTARNKRIMLQRGSSVEIIDFSKLADDLQLNANEFDFKTITLADPAPTRGGFYFPTQIGTYARFGNIEIIESDLNSAFTFIVFDGFSFSKSVKTLGIGEAFGVAPLDENKKIPNENINFGKVAEGDPRAVSGDEVFSKTVNPADIGIININIGDNLISEYTPDKLEDNTIWVRGYFRKTDGEIIEETVPGSTYRSKNLIKVNKLSSYNYRFRLRGNIGVCFFDKDLSFISSISTESPTAQNVIGDVVIDENIEYMGLSFTGNTSTSFSNEFKSNNNYREVTSDVFITNDETGNTIIRDNVDVAINLDYQERGVNDIPVDTNFISALNGSDINNTDLWGVGFFRADGSVLSLPDWRYSRFYYEIKKGTYSYHLYFNGTAKCLIYNKEKQITQLIENNTTSTDLATGKITITEDSYVRISFREAGDINRVNLINISNDFLIKSTIITDNNYKQYIETGNSIIRDNYLNMFSAKKKTPIVTFISDDGHINDKLWLKPMLDAYKVKATLAISKHWVDGADDGSLTNRLTSDDIIELHKDGFDIANHTVNHFYLNEITLEEAEDEIMLNKLFLEGLISDDVNMFVSPYGVRSAALDYVISKYNYTNFISGYGVRNELPLDNFFINRVSFDTQENNKLLWDSDLLPALNTCLENKEWLVFAIHTGYNTYTPSNPVYIERRNELNKIMDFCKTNGIQIMTAKGAYSYFKNNINIGVRRYSEEYYQLGMDGSEINAGYFI